MKLTEERDVISIILYDKLCEKKVNAYTYIY